MSLLPPNVSAFKVCTLLFSWRKFSVVSCSHYLVNIPKKCTSWFTFYVEIIVPQIFMYSRWQVLYSHNFMFTIMHSLHQISLILNLFYWFLIFGPLCWWMTHTQMWKVSFSSHLYFYVMAKYSSRYVTLHWLSLLFLHTRAILCHSSTSWQCPYSFSSFIGVKCLFFARTSNPSLDSHISSSPLQHWFIVIFGGILLSCCIQLWCCIAMLDAW